MLTRLTGMFFAFALLVCAEHHFTGTWKFNAAKSKASGMPKMKEATVTYSPEGTGWRYEMKGTREDGQAMSTSFVYTKDGEEIKMSGSPLGETMVLKDGAADTGTGTFMRGGKAVGKVKRVVSADGKTMTISGDSVMADGKKVTYTSVYDKQ